MTEPSILIRQRKGGVGKSAVAIALENALSSFGKKPRLIDADTPEEGDEGASLSATFGDRVELFAINANAARVEADVNELRRHWWPLCEAIMAGNALIDFGANTNNAFESAIEEGGWGFEFEDAGTKIINMIPVTTNAIALRGGVEAVEATRRIMPTSRIIVVLCEKEKSFATIDGDPLYQRLLEEKTNGVDFIHFPKCASTLWTPIELAGIDYRTALAAATSDPGAFGARIRMSRPDVRLGIGKLTSWYDGVVKEFQAAGLVPSAAPAKKAAKA